MLLRSVINQGGTTIFISGGQTSSKSNPHCFLGGEYKKSKVSVSFNIISSNKYWHNAMFTEYSENEFVEMNYASPT